MALAHNTTVTSLNVSYNKIGPRGAKLNLHLLLIGAPAPQRENRKLIGVLGITGNY